MNQRGLTLMEVVVVAAIAMVVAGIIFFSLNSFRQTQALHNATEQLIGLLDEARSRTLASLNGSAHGVHLDAANRQAVLFQGGAYPGTNQLTTSFDPALTLTYSVGGGSDIIFERLTGRTDQIGTITLTLTADGTKQRVISVDGSGLVQLKSAAN